MGVGGTEAGCRDEAVVFEVSAKLIGTRRGVSWTPAGPAHLSPHCHTTHPPRLPRRFATDDLGMIGVGHAPTAETAAIFAATWNLGEGGPSAEAIASWLPKGRDVYVIGLQARVVVSADQHHRTVSAALPVMTT